VYHVLWERCQELKCGEQYLHHFSYDFMKLMMLRRQEEIVTKSTRHNSWGLAIVPRIF
jgi:hypothetical protein